MRIVLSRKGFDSSLGGIASPILPNGELLSLPIPELDPKKQRCRYSELRFQGYVVDEILRQLLRGRNPVPEFAHLDPDLRRDTIDRDVGWQPAFGQSGAAQAHLKRQGVTKGDLFLFFGWFREVSREWKYVKGAPARHVLFGWLQVDRSVDVAAGETESSVANHPHLGVVRGVVPRAVELC